MKRGDAEAQGRREENRCKSALIAQRIKNLLPSPRFGARGAEL